jgi:hypothetical protein
MPLTLWWNSLSVKFIKFCQVLVSTHGTKHDSQQLRCFCFLIT